MKRAGAKVLRGGAFKPRTSPYSFQGLGVEGLRYLAEARERTGLPASDPEREKAQIAKLRALALEADLDPEFSEKFIRFVIDEVIRHHQHLNHLAGK